MRICFDVDGTLIDYNDTPRPDIIGLLIPFSREFKITVWSGGGKEYAEQIVRKLRLEAYVEYCLTKDSAPPPDTAFTVDDMVVNFGVPNLYVGPATWTKEVWESVKAQQARVMSQKDSQHA